MRQADVPTIEQALNGLVTAILRHEQSEREARTGPAEIRIWSAAELMAGPMLNQAESAIVRMAEDPIGGACRQGIRQCGERLWSLTKSVDAMGDVLERVADRDPARYGARASIMDHAWDGIGGAWFA